MVFSTLIKRVLSTPYGVSRKPLMLDVVPNALCMASGIRCIFNLIWPILDGGWPTHASSVGNTLILTFFVSTSFLASENLHFLVVIRKLAEVELQLGKKIKVVKSDRGGEYYGRYDGSGEQRLGPFVKYLEECGIVP
ncbi:putative transposable element-related protein [Cucumis melo var. makuwa]|uniref:Transposable element-related protein n=1 Tax=Cucumis melo var. makuwa TaxID=1194695 RepID=A0A5A7SYN2_CUCMM|nr:putative transposable element-related protein [Cucumis melo var. makuwa]TYK19725.1 putative transposable element-related protein [Cucumis melo var. makuwa]